MGYYINQEDADFRILAGNIPAAHQALRNAAEGQDWGWVDMDVVATAPTFREAMSVARWEVFMNDAGDVIDIAFDGEKAAEEDEPLAAIAPFVEAGSWIEMSGEEGERWRWTFDGKTIDEERAMLVWPGKTAAKESGDLAAWAQSLSDTEFVELVRGDLALWEEIGSPLEQEPTWHPWAMRRILAHIDTLKAGA